jgi:predicted metal-dependent HD superfamily phosphohydrolase/pimeloyl-ACP methyl ester carboxylesterase
MQPVERTPQQQRLQPVPIESGRTELNGNSFAWDSFGAKGAQPLLLLHGTSLNRRSFYDVVDFLGESSHIVAVDIRGHGQSWTGGSHSYSTPEFGEDIFQMIQNFWPGKRAVVVGASVSGLHVIQAAHTYPDAIEALVLVDVLPTFDASKIRGALAFTSKSFESVENAVREVMQLFVTVAPEDRPSPERIKELLDRFLSPKEGSPGVEYRYDKAFLTYLMSQEHTELWNCLEAIHHPVLLLTPALGSIVPEDAIERLALSKPNAEHVVVPGSRHSIMHDQPKLFSDAVQKFLATRVENPRVMRVMHQRVFSEHVEAAWIDALTRLGVSVEEGRGAIASVIADFELRWEGYHNLKHLSEVLAFLYSFEHEVEDMASAILAVIAHDRIYDPRSGTNEEESAEWARREFKEIGIPQEVIERSCALVLATKKHMPVPELYDSRLFLDADLAILSAAPHRYVEYARGIRHEYSHTTVKEYSSRRANVLEGLIARAPFYFCGDLYPERDKVALENVGREIVFLREAQDSGILDFTRLLG